MDINKKNRSDLKSYFVKNSIPTASNFADLIDGMLNQKDDGIVKQSGDPLSIEAAGDLTGLQKVLNFYGKLVDANPAWSLQLNPRMDDKTTNRGFCLVDGANVSRLFIEQSTGNIGIATITPKAKLDINGIVRFGLDENGSGIKSISFARDTGDDGNAGKITYKGNFGADSLNIVGAGAPNTKRKIKLYDNVEVVGSLNVTGGTTLNGNVGIGTNSLPSAKLDIAQVARTGTHPTAIKGLYITGDFGGDADGIEFRHTNGTQGIGFGFNTIYAAGSIANQDLNLKAKGTGSVTVTGASTISGNLTVNSAFFAGNSDIYFTKTDHDHSGFGNTEGYAAIENAKSYGALMILGRSVNQVRTVKLWDYLQVIGGLDVTGAITPSAGNTVNNGIMFPKDPGGGGGDAAWIRYYARPKEGTGESCTLEIGITNDADDHIALIPSGNVGIGTTSPTKAKLEIA